MPPAIVVTLRRSQTPVFPDRCAFSDQPCDHETIVLLTRDGLRRRALWAGWYHIRVPCRSNLKWRVHLTRAWRFIRTVVVGLGSLALAAYVLYPTLKDVWLGLSSLAFTVACLGGLVWWDKNPSAGVQYHCPGKCGGVCVSQPEIRPGICEVEPRAD